jgi:outer membrane protein assembly factor BamB
MFNLKRQLNQRILFILVLFSCLLVIFRVNINAQSEKTKLNAGNKVWEFEAKEKLVAPIFAQGKIYIGNSKVIYVLDVESGKNLSEFNIQLDVPIISITFSDDKLYTWGAEVKNKVNIHCFDAKIGKELWKYEGEGTGGVTLSGCPPSLPPIGPAIYKGKIYLPGGAESKTPFGGLTCLDAKTGKVLWQDKEFGCICSAPVIYNELLYVTAACPRNTTRCYDLNTSSVKWEFGTKNPEYHSESSVSVFQDRLYFYTSKGVNCLNPKTGNLIKDTSIQGLLCLEEEEEEMKIDGLGIVKTRHPKPGQSVIARISQDKKRVYITNSKNLYCFSKNEMEKKPLWLFNPQDELSFPAVGGNKLYVGCANKNLYCLDAKTGAELWKFATEDLIRERFKGQNIISAPILCNGKVYITSDKKLYCIASGDSKCDGWFGEGGGPEHGGYNRKEKE